MALTSASWVLGAGVGVELQAISVRATAVAAQRVAIRFICISSNGDFAKRGPCCWRGRLRGSAIALDSSEGRRRRGSPAGRTLVLETKEPYCLKLRPFSSGDYGVAGGNGVVRTFAGRIELFGEGLRRMPLCGRRLLETRNRGSDDLPDSAGSAVFAAVLGLVWVSPVRLWLSTLPLPFSHFS